MNKIYEAFSVLNFKSNKNRSISENYEPCCNFEPQKALGNSSVGQVDPGNPPVRPVVQKLLSRFN